MLFRQYVYEEYFQYIFRNIKHSSKLLLWILWNFLVNFFVEIEYTIWNSTLKQKDKYNKDKKHEKPWTARLRLSVCAGWSEGQVQLPGDRIGKSTEISYDHQEKEKKEINKKRKQTKMTP